MIPLTAGFRGDFVHILVPVEESDTIATVAQKVADHVVPFRIAMRPLPMSVRYDGEILPDEMTVAECGIQSMHFVEVFYRES